MEDFLSGGQVRRVTFYYNTTTIEMETCPPNKLSDKKVSATPVSLLYIDKNLTILV